MTALLQTAILQLVQLLTCADIETHSGPIAVPGPLKCWNVGGKILVLQMYYTKTISYLSRNCELN